jgi:hypothetical protein
MQVSVNFPSQFDKDNFTSRRTTGHNLYDPEALITGKEIAQGFTYKNSTRKWASESHYLDAVSHHLTPEQIAETAPREFLANVHPELADYGLLDYSEKFHELWKDYENGN